MHPKQKNANYDGLAKASSKTLPKHSLYGLPYAIYLVMKNKGI